MTISECIHQIKDEGYQNNNIFIRLTGRADNLCLCVGEKFNNKFHYFFHKYDSKEKVMKEIKRLIIIYIVTESQGRAKSLTRKYTYYKQYIN